MLRSGRTAAVILLSFSGLLLPSLQAALDRSEQAPPQIAQARAPRVSPIGAQPLHFELNEGQTDPRVAYLARGRGYALFLTPDEVVVGLQQKWEQAAAQSETAASGLDPGGNRSSEARRSDCISSGATRRVASPGWIRSRGEVTISWATIRKDGARISLTTRR